MDRRLRRKRRRRRRGMVRKPQLRICLENNILILIIKYVYFVVLCDVIPEFSRTEETIQSAVRYPSDLTDEEGEILEPLINELESYTIGRPRKSNLCEI